MTPIVPTPRSAVASDVPATVDGMPRTVNALRTTEFLKTLVPRLVAGMGFPLSTGSIASARRERLERRGFE